MYAAAAPILASSTRCNEPRCPWPKEARDEHCPHRPSRPHAPRPGQRARRPFLQLLGGGLLVCFGDAPGIAQESGRAFGGRQQVPSDISAWIHVAADNKISVFTGKVEVGQNIRTSQIG